MGGVRCTRMALVAALIPTSLLAASCSSGSGLVQSQDGYTWYTCTSPGACVKFIRGAGFNGSILTIPSSRMAAYRTGWYYPPSTRLRDGSGIRLEYVTPNNESFEELVNHQPLLRCSYRNYGLETTPLGRSVCFGDGRAFFSYEGLHYDIAPVAGPLNGSRQHAFVLVQVDRLTSTPGSSRVQLVPSL